MKTYERDGVIYITAPELAPWTCRGCAALEFEIHGASDCGGFPPSAPANANGECKGSIWIKSPEQKK